MGLTDPNGTVVVRYQYNAWGKLLSITGSLSATVGVKNPFRYRGYYYDTETGMYYLKSRYYDPEIGRFSNTDNWIPGVGGNINDYNLYSYCSNNPINRIDPDGYAWKDISDLFSNACNTVKTNFKQFAKNVKNKLTKKHYEERAKKNGTHPTYNQVVSNSGWTKVSKDQSKFHDNGIGKPEQKFTHNDGREAVFDGDTLLEMKDPRYIATYNFCPIQQLPDNPGIKDYFLYGLTTIEHGWKDVLPYWIWGNSNEDTTTILERIKMCY